MSMRFDDKSVVITGGVGGIGQALVQLFASEGANVLLSDRSEEDCEDFCEALKRRGLEILYLAGDLRQKNYCEALIAEAALSYGSIDILINNAGIIPRGNILETTDDMWFSAMDVNLNAVFFLCRAAIPHMQEAGGGAIINVSSTWGLYPGPDHVAYCTSKAALAALTRNLGRRHSRQRGLPQRSQHADAAHRFPRARHRPGQRDRGAGQDRAPGTRRRARGSRRRGCLPCLA